MLEPWASLYGVRAWTWDGSIVCWMKEEEGCLKMRRAWSDSVNSRVFVGSRREGCLKMKIDERVVVSVGLASYREFTCFRWIRYNTD